jgi:hypothetical protein
VVAEEVATKEFLDDAKLLNKMQDTDTSSVESEIDLTQYFHPPIWAFYCGFGGMRLKIQTNLKMAKAKKYVLIIIRQQEWLVLLLYACRLFRYMLFYNPETLTV